MPFREIGALPTNLKPAIRGIEYSPLDELLKKYANDETKLKFLRKYEQYFKAITAEPSYTQSLMNVTNENSDYLKKHRLWFPYMKLDALNLPKIEDLIEQVDKEGSEPSDKTKQEDEIHKNTTTTKKKLEELTAALETNFFNYLHIPYMFGEEPIPPLINHVSDAVNNDIYTMGGLTLMNQQEQTELLHQITDDGLIPLENVQVNFNYNLPVPLNRDILKSPFMKPNTDLYVYSTSSQTLYKPDLKLSQKFIKRPSQTTLEENEIPPGLLACQSCVISTRHIFYYGGFELRTKITKHATSAVIDKEIVMNNEAWVLDTTTLKFKHVSLTVHPTLTTRFPAAIPRFGHICMGVPIEEMNCDELLSSKETVKSYLSMNSHDKQFPHPALVYIVGGYKQSTNSKDFIPLNDIWKLELFINYENKKSNYITFSDASLAYPIGDFDLDERNYDDFQLGRFSGQSDLSSSSDEEDNVDDLDQDSNSSKSKMRSRRSSSNFGSPKQPATLFSGIIKNDKIEWPDPRGFFAGNLFDNSQLYKGVISEKPSIPSLSNIAHPIPKRNVPISSTAGNSGIYKTDSHSPGRSSPLSNVVTNAFGPGNFSISPPGINQNRSFFSTPDASKQRRKSFSQRADPGSRRMSPGYSPIGTSNSSQAVSAFKGFTVNKTLIIHGGSTLQYKVVTNPKTGKTQKFTRRKILSDLWWFNLADEKWTKIPTYINNLLSSKNNDVTIQDAQVKRCGHTLLKLDDRYLVLMGGALEIDFKHEAFFNNYKKDTSSGTEGAGKTFSDGRTSTSSGGRPNVSSDDSNVEDIQELALKIGSMSFSKHEESRANSPHYFKEDEVYSKTSPTSANDNYHRMLILDTQTQCWRISRYFHNFNVRAKNYSDTPLLDEELLDKIGDSLKRLFFSNICGSAVLFDSKIFILGGECKPHLPAELAKIESSSLTDLDTKVLFSSVCVFEIPVGN